MVQEKSLPHVFRVVSEPETKKDSIVYTFCYWKPYNNDRIRLDLLKGRIYMLWIMAVLHAWSDVQHVFNVSLILNDLITEHTNIYKASRNQIVFYLVIPLHTTLD